ncbi:hypothetical protein HMI54_012435 [Coelomomyces lativittatus]|nr:hypothetical protein HMI54_012435 [Coelomomyces lativittatus]
MKYFPEFSVVQKSKKQQTVNICNVFVNAPEETNRIEKICKGVVYEPEPKAILKNFCHAFMNTADKKTIVETMCSGERTVLNKKKTLENICNTFITYHREILDFSSAALSYKKFLG